MAEALTGYFTVMWLGQSHRYRDYDRIPDEIDEVVEFLPDIPPPPHTPAQHHLIEAWPDRLQALLRRCHATRNSRR